MALACWKDGEARCVKRTLEDSLDTKLKSGPDYLKEAFRYLCRELDRQQGMIEDLNTFAITDFGLSQEDCDLLGQCVSDRDNLKKATEAIAAVFY